MRPRSCCPVLDGVFPAPTFGPGAEHTSESAEGIGWSIEDDVLARRTTGPDRLGVRVRHAVRRPRPRGLPRRGLGRPAHLRPACPRGDDVRPVLAARRGRVEVQVRSVMDLAIVDGSVDVTIDTWASRDGVEVSHRRWEERDITG